MGNEEFIKLDDGTQFGFKYKEIKESDLEGADAETKRLFNIFAGEDHVLQETEAQSLFSKIKTAASGNTNGSNSIFDSGEMREFLSDDSDTQPAKSGFNFNITSLISLIKRLFAVKENTGDENSENTESEEAVVISVEDRTLPDGGKEIITKYDNGITETVEYYENGDYKQKKIEKRFTETKYEIIIDGEKRELTEEEYQEALSRMKDMGNNQTETVTSGEAGKQIIKISSPNIEIRSISYERTEEEVHFSPRYIAESLGVDISTADGKKIVERMYLLPEKVLDILAEQSTELKGLIESNELEPTFDNISNILEFTQGITLRDEEELSASEEQRQAIALQIQAVQILSSLYETVAAYNEQYTDSIGLFGLGAEGIGYLLNKLGIEGENHYQWAQSCREYAQKLQEFKFLNPEKFNEEFKAFRGVDFDVDAFRQIIEMFNNNQHADENDNLTKEFKELVLKTCNMGKYDLNNPNNDTFTMVMNGLGEIILMLMTLGASAETTGSKVLAQGTYATFRNLGVGLASKQAGSKLLQGALRYTGQGIKLIGPMVNEGTKFALYTLGEGTVTNVIDSSVKDKTLEEFIQREYAVGEAAIGSFEFGAFAGLWGSTVTQKVMQYAQKSASKVSSALAERFSHGAVNASEVYAEILEKSAPTALGEAAAFAADVFGFTAFETALALVKNSNPEELSLEDIVNLLWEEFKGQGYNLGQIKGISLLIMFLTGSRSARVQAVKSVREGYIPQLKDIMMESTENGGYKIKLPNGREVECKNSVQMISAMHLIVKSETAFSGKFDTRETDGKNSLKNMTPEELNTEFDRLLEKSKDDELSDAENTKLRDIAEELDRRGLWSDTPFRTIPFKLKQSVHSKLGECKTKKEFIESIRLITTDERIISTLENLSESEIKILQKASDKIIPSGRNLSYVKDYDFWMVDEAEDFLDFIYVLESHSSEKNRTLSKELELVDRILNEKSSEDEPLIADAICMYRLPADTKQLDIMEKLLDLKKTCDNPGLTIDDIVELAAMYKGISDPEILVKRLSEKNPDGTYKYTKESDYSNRYEVDPAIMEADVQNTKTMLVDHMRRNNYGTKFPKDVQKELENFARLWLSRGKKLWEIKSYFDETIADSYLRQNDVYYSGETLKLKEMIKLYCEIGVEDAQVAKRLADICMGVNRGLWKSTFNERVSVIREAKTIGVEDTYLENIVCSLLNIYDSEGSHICRRYTTFLRDLKNYGIADENIAGITDICSWNPVNENYMEIFESVNRLFNSCRQAGVDAETANTVLECCIYARSTEAEVNFPLSQKIELYDKLCTLSDTAKGILSKTANINVDNILTGLETLICAKRKTIEPQEGAQQRFLQNIIGNRQKNEAGEKILKTFDFAQYGKDGLPLEYSRREFVSDIKNIFEKYNISEDERSAILQHFGIEWGSGGEDFDGLPNNKPLDKSLSSDAQKAAEEILEKINDFTVNNKVNTGVSEADRVLNALIQGLPEFTSVAGKEQHGTHQYSVDVHMLKVLQSAMNDPLYDTLSDLDKTILKISILLHDLGKKGGTVDKGHAAASASYVNAVLDKFNFPRRVRDRILDIVENHHWFEAYNKGEISAEDVAIRCRRPEDFKIYQIFAKADLENVSETFHYNVTGTTSETFDNFIQEKMQPIADAMERMYSKSNLVFDTQFVRSGEWFPSVTVEINGEPVELRVLNLNEIEDGASLTEYGFAHGVTKENARFIVHMTEPENMYPVVVLTANSLNQTSWSTSLIKTANNRTYCSKKFGFIFDVDQANIAEAYFQNLSSGYEKDINSFKDIIFDYNGQERTFVKDNMISMLKEKGIELNDNDYQMLTQKLINVKYLQQIRSDITINGKTIPADVLRECLEASRDELFEGGNIHSEIVVINPRIKGLIAIAESIEDCPQEFLEFAKKHNLPIIIMRSQHPEGYQ